MIADEIIAEVLDRVDVVAVVGRVVQLKKAGTVYKGLCPFHQERSPSFTVSPTRGTYHCFGCQVHGHAIHFLMRYHGQAFPEAVRALAAEVGVEVPEEKPLSPRARAERDRQRTEAERLLLVQDQLAAHFTETLFGRTGARARQYLERRGITRRAAEAFRLGYADGDRAAFEAWQKAKGIEAADLVTLGVLVPPEAPEPGPLGGAYLRFRERVIFPVVDGRGEVVGFGGRILDDEKKVAKYINSPETPVYTKGEQLYGAFTAQRAARREGRVVLCEGNVDVIALWQAGFEGTVAAMGTALTPKQVRLVKRMGERVVCVMDGDGAGRKAAFASLIPFLEAGVAPRAVMLPDGDDPDSYVGREGADAFRALLDAAPPLLDVQIAHEAGRHPPDPPGRTAALRALVPALRLLADPVERALYRDKVASTLGISEALVERAESEPVAPARTERRAAPAPAPRGEPGRSGRQTPAQPSHDLALAPPHDLAVPPPHDLAVPPPDWAPPPDGPPPDLDGPPPWGAEEDADRAALASRLRTFDAMPPAERQLVDILLHFPSRTPRAEERGGLAALTDREVAAFFLRLCEKVRGGETPDEIEMIAELPERALVVFLSNSLAKRPSQTEETVDAALDSACERVVAARQKRLRDEAWRQRMGTAAASVRPVRSVSVRSAGGGRGHTPSSKKQGAH